MTERQFEAPSLRSLVTWTATAVVTVPIATLVIFAAIFVRNEAMRPDAAFYKYSRLCGSIVAPYPFSENRPDAPKWIPYAVSEKCLNLFGAASTSDDGQQIAPSLPITLSDLKKIYYPGKGIETVHGLATYSSITVIPELSLWPLTTPDRIGFRIIREGRTINIADPVGYKSSQFRAQLSDSQRTLNIQILLMIFGAIMFIGLFAGVVWTATGRVLRPVEAIRREMADITEHNLARRVPVPPARNEIARLASTVNATLDRLEAAVQNNRRFVADASHELRSPIAALRAELEIATAHPDLTDWPTVIDAALADTHRLQRLATDLLLLARLDHAADTSAANDHHNTIDLTALISDQSSHRRSRHTLTAELPDRPVPVHGSRPLLGRLLGNLLDNAERHATTTIAIRLTITDRQAILEVLDDGPGIPPQDRERVFDRFTRLDHARTRDIGGTGLGLAIARRIAATHTGSLHATDHPSGTGACLIASLPIRL